MWLLTAKRRVSVQTWCDDFYSEFVFSSDIAGRDPWRTFAEATQKHLASQDPRLSTIAMPAFADELLALRLEVIGVTWILCLPDKLSPYYNKCTRLYLSRHNLERFWDMMEPYNKAVAQATLDAADPTTRLARAHIVFMNGMRKGLFADWVSAGCDPQDAARAANRIGSAGGPWIRRTTHRYLSCALTDALHAQANQAARKAMAAVIQGFYEGTIKALREVKITG